MAPHSSQATLARCERRDRYIFFSIGRAGDFYATLDAFKDRVPNRPPTLHRTPRPQAAQQSPTQTANQNRIAQIAQTATYPPDVKYAQPFRNAQAAAQNESRGLWR